jgi:hypothetical protein
MSRRTRSHGDRLQEPLMRRLERASADLNPILVVIIAGLAILNFSVYAALQLAPLPHRAWSCRRDKKNWRTARRPSRRIESHGADVGSAFVQNPRAPCKSLKAPKTSR